MFQSFTGNSRRPRQVNLSGRNPNPFANVGGTGGVNTTLANAQQERAQREKERQRLRAAKTLQRAWRGHDSRNRVKSSWRVKWDNHEQTSGGYQTGGSPRPYNSDEESLMQLRLLAHFFNPRDAADVQRLLHHFSRSQPLNLDTAHISDSRSLAYLRLENLCLEGLEFGVRRPAKGTQVLVEIDYLLEALGIIAELIPQQTALNSGKYYRVLACLTVSHQLDERMTLFLRVLTTPLRTIHSETLNAYEGLASQYLIILDLHNLLEEQNGMDALADQINIRLLARATADLLNDRPHVPRAPNAKSPFVVGKRERLALLSNFIFFHRKAHNFSHSEAYSSNDDFVAVVASLLSSLADEIDVEKRTFTNASYANTPSTFSEFTQAQILSLVNQDSIVGMLRSAHNSSNQDPKAIHDSVVEGIPSKFIHNMASYTLTLLRLFPRRGDEIRMWLYLGSTETLAGTNESATKFFWEAVRRTDSFQKITHDSKATLELLRARNRRNQTQWQPPRILEEQDSKLDDEWRLILVFMELYTFMLKVTDDEEFFSGSQVGSTRQPMASSRKQQKTLPLSAVQELSIFLKHLGFAMYFHGAEFSDVSGSEVTVDRKSDYSGHTAPNAAPNQVVTDDANRTNSHLPGISSISIDYIKGLTTGLLRMIYERDSRRKFLPDEHWLMTSRFNMDSFIPAVVEEEESRHQLDEAINDGDDFNEEEEEGDDGYDQPSLVGTGRAQQIRQSERLRREQARLSRKRYLQAVAPRLEILQNMPFLIPFATRVQIFREFVHLDQIKRRNGYTDPDTWRMAMQTNPNEPGTHELSKHTAKIRRKHEFEDAYDQFYELGNGLKEPIQITFVDQFDTVEAGIDGGGVTKEFLTSVTSQAFSPSEGINLFVENDQHLLYPNPTVMEEKKHLLREAGIMDNTQDFRRETSDLLQRYEFLGRIVGKCLYEGILIDIGFAGFFLLKWALTGGSGSAPNESGYRANLNDLRDLDEELYQGLLQLKNYSGDVEDFSLNFTVTDTIPTGPQGQTKTITRDLKRDGANLPVTNANRLVYISYMARYRLQAQPYPQTTAFLRGLASIIQPAWLSMFNQAELQTLIGGASAGAIDVADLRAHTQYGGVYVLGDDGLEHPSVQLFWRVMERLDDRDRRAVLKFVTSTPRAPLLGFASLNPRFSIRDAGDDQDRLPSTSTCVNLLKLPRFREERVLREKLLYAVNSGAGFDLS
ncbi:MAG: hypothetical protein M1821_006132 [Bathelium mastoideum]|nr:MAG: hypothetical protein M1821_006132 [Bathelium mastoideum]